MKRKCFSAMIAFALFIAGCGTSTAKFQSVAETTIDPSAVIDFNGLQWLVGPDQPTNWNEAKAWVDGLGGNWRMPTPAELQGLWDAGISDDNWGPFQNSGFWVWSGEIRDSSSAWVFRFSSGREYCTNRGYSNYKRVFAARSR